MPIKGHCKGRNGTYYFYKFIIPLLTDFPEFRISLKKIIFVIQPCLFCNKKKQKYLEKHDTYRENVANNLKRLKGTVMQNPPYLHIYVNVKGNAFFLVKYFVSKLSIASTCIYSKFPDLQLSNRI